MLDAALGYAKMGLSVIPLHGKRPFFDNWVEVATAEPKTVERWWTQSPHDNIGIATGAKSKVFVFDVDPRNGGKDTYEMLQEEHGAFPDTWQVVTGGGGIHLYFRYPAFSIKSVSGLFPGIDIKGDGGQVVAPPSIHPDTHNPYEWDGLTPFEDQRIAEAPPWLLERLEQGSARARTQGMHTVQPKIHHGQQHTALVSLAGQLRRMGLNEEEIFPAVWAVNQNRCERPGPEVNIRQIAHSMMRYQPGERALAAEANRLWRLTRLAEEQHAANMTQLTIMDGLEVMRSQAKESVLVIEDMLPSGLTIFAGRPKCGKSWLALQIAIATAMGTKLMGAKRIMRPGRVAYFSLEEPEALTARRMRRLLEHEDVTLQNIEFIYQLPAFREGGREIMASYLQHAQPSLIVVDSLTALMGFGRARSEDVFRADYQEIKALRELALGIDSSMLVIHHAKKGGSLDDPIESVSGTMGRTASADSVWRLRRQEEGGGVLEIVGRELEEQTYALKLDLNTVVAGWAMVSQGEEARHSEERSDIVELLREDGPISPKEIANRLRKNENTVRRLIQKLKYAGVITKNSDGKYVACATN